MPYIWPVAVMPTLALSLPIALVLPMIKGRRLFSPGGMVEPRQRIEPVAGTGLQPRQLGLIAHPLPHLGVGSG